MATKKESGKTKRPLAVHDRLSFLQRQNFVFLRNHRRGDRQFGCCDRLPGRLNIWDLRALIARQAVLLIPGNLKPHRSTNCSSTKWPRKSDVGVMNRQGSSYFPSVSGNLTFKRYPSEKRREWLPSSDTVVSKTTNGLVPCLL